VSRDEDAAQAIATAARRRLGDAAIHSLRVFPEEDHVGEPALSVLIDLTDQRFRPSGADFIALVKAMRDELQDVDDTRFPYVSISAPGDEQAEDTRGAA
jgi:hypothetical protein